MRRPRPLPRIPGQHGVFSTAQARARRWTVSGLRHAATTGRADRLWRGVYAEPVTADAAGQTRRRLQLAVAATVSNSGVLVSHLPATTLHGWSSWAPRPQACASHGWELAVTRVPGVHVHRAELGFYDRWTVGTVPVTSPGRTVVDIAREYGTEAGLCAADAAAHAGDLRRVDLERAVRQARDWPGGRHAGLLPELFDPRAESVLESRSRWAMRGAGVPPPMTQVELYDRRTGRFLGRVDFFWPELGVVGEADGLGKYVGWGSVVAEKTREDDVRRLELEVVRWVWAELDRFEVVTRRFWQAADLQASRRGQPALWIARQDPVPAFRHPDSMAAPPMWEFAPF